MDVRPEYHQRGPEQSRSLSPDFARIPICPAVPGTIQRKLAIGEPSDRYEQEADRTAERVMRLPEAALQRKCACGGTCPHCEEEHARLQPKRESGSAASQAEAPPLVHEVLRSPGRPLDAATRAFMEPRFGRDFSQVRIHSGAAAEQSAADVNAMAYTVRNNIVFARGRFAPETGDGQRLLAHELVHVLQQSGAGSAIPGPRLQRACGPAHFRGTPGCVGRGGDITDFGGDSSKFFKFRVNCDEFLPGERERVRFLAQGLLPSENMLIDGFASEEGPAGFNEALSCARAKALAFALNEAGISSDRIDGIYMHGATPGDREEHRSAVVTTPRRTAGPEDCGDWIGNCEFYLCRERRHPCGDGGYYKGYGYKYCNRFSRLARSLSAPGRDWVWKTLRCLHEHLDRNVPIDAPCQEVKKSAFDSHPDCYVRSGVCFLDVGEMKDIVETIDPQDNDIKQVLITGVDCIGNVAPVALFPVTSLSVGGGYGGLMERDRQRMFRLSQPPRVGR